MGDFDRRQLEQLNAIGEYLQHVRQDQGRSLDDISAKTYIPLRILRALEGGQGAILPEPVFVQGFIRRYADALGLNGMDLSRSFPLEHESINYESSEPDRRESAQKLVETRLTDTRYPNARFSDARSSNGRYSDPYVERNAERNAERNVKRNGDRSGGEPAPQPRRRSGSMPPSLPASLPFAIAAVLVLGGFFYALSRLFAPQQPQPITTTGTVAPASPAPTTAAAAPSNSPSPSGSPASTVSATSGGTGSPAAKPPAANSAASGSTNSPATNSPINVAMNVTVDSWVEVTTDGKVTFEGILKKGTQRTWFAQKELTIVSGNAGGVALSYNRGTAKPMGSLGTVEEVTFTPNSGSSASGSGTAPN